MKNRWFLVVIVILLVSFLITGGCGVSQSQYAAVSLEVNKAKQDQQAAQTQLQKTQTDLIAAQTQLQKTQTDLIATYTQLQKAQTDLTALQTQMQTTQSELARTKTDLQTAQSQVQSLQKDQGAAAQKRAEASSYADLLVMSMYEIWMGAGINPGYTFSNAADWKMAMTNKAAGIKDANLSNYIGQLDKGGKNAAYTLWYYCISRINQDLK